MMIFPWQLCLSLARYVGANKIQGRRRFPLILMLEPTFRCNLSCAGCGRIREDSEILGRMMTAEECLSAADEAGSPVVCITGGEPLLHPQIGEIVEGLLARKRFTYLATNGILVLESLPKLEPSPYFSFVFHVDGLAKTHDANTRPGVFEQALAGMQAAKAAGFQVRTNTTLFRGTDWEEVRELFTLLSHLQVDGIMIAPAFSYERVDADIFLTRSETIALCQRIYQERWQFRFYNTPIYLEFLAGKRNLTCSPWSAPARNPRGWNRPCYLIADEHPASYRELMEQTQWERYGVGNDPRCANCMMHCGFEASGIDQTGKSLADLWHMVRWNFTGH